MEKLQQRNMTIEMKHYEDCEQFFLTVGKSFAVEALLHFFRKETKDSPITQNRPPYYITGNFFFTLEIISLPYNQGIYTLIHINCCTDGKGLLYLLLLHPDSSKEIS